MYLNLGGISGFRIWLKMAFYFWAISDEKRGERRLHEPAFNKIKLEYGDENGHSTLSVDHVHNMQDDAQGEHYSCKFLMRAGALKIDSIDTSALKRSTADIKTPGVLQKVNVECPQTLSKLSRLIE